MPSSARGSDLSRGDDASHAVDASLLERLGQPLHYRRMLVDDIKKRAVAAAKEGDTVTRDVLRFALGELQTAEATKNRALREEESAATLRKLIESNEETMRALVVAACAEPD